MDGVELVRRLKAEHPDLPVVVMTAYGTIESAVESVRLGAADYLVKPFEVPELLMVIRHAIELHELRAASRATLRRNQERFTLRNVLVIALAQLVSSLAFSRMSRRFSVLKTEVDELLRD